MDEDIHVFSRDVLDEEEAKQFVYPWLTQTPDGFICQYETEGAACSHQRFWRRMHGLDPMTGERFTTIDIG